MPVRLAVIRSHKCLNKIPGHCWAHGSAAHADYVQVIVFDTLPGGEVIVDEPSANARHLVGTYRRADSTAANSHASIHVAGCDCLRERNHEIGIIGMRMEIAGAAV